MYNNLCLVKNSNNRCEMYTTITHIQFSIQLHTYFTNGTNIQQVSFNKYTFTKSQSQRNHSQIQMYNLLLIQPIKSPYPIISVKQITFDIFHPINFFHSFFQPIKTTFSTNEISSFYFFNQSINLNKFKYSQSDTLP